MIYPERNFLYENIKPGDIIRVGTTYYRDPDADDDDDVSCDSTCYAFGNFHLVIGTFPRQVASKVTYLALPIIYMPIYNPDNNNNINELGLLSDEVVTLKINLSGKNYDIIDLYGKISAEHLDTIIQPYRMMLNP